MKQVTREDFVIGAKFLCLKGGFGSHSEWAGHTLRVSSIYRDRVTIKNANLGSMAACHIDTWRGLLTMVNLATQPDKELFMYALSGKYTMDD